MARPSKGPWLRKGRGYWVWKDGARVYLSHDLKEAKQKWHRLQSGETIDEVCSPGHVSFADAAEAYCAQIESTRTARHLRGTQWRLNQLSERLGKRSLSSLRMADVEAVLSGKAWGPTTRANVLTTLRGLLRWASRPGGLIPSNPLPVLTLPRAETRVHVMTAEQIQRLLEHSPTELRRLLKALADTGARPSELIRAKAADCDVDGSAVRLARGKQGRRIIFFPPSAREEMATLRRVNLGGSLFTQPNGDAWSEYWFYALTRKARRAAKLPDWATSYTLRHSWITARMRERNPTIPLATIARMAGTSVTLLDKVYGHLSDDDLREVADGMG
jgi:integrase